MSRVTKVVLAVAVVAMVSAGIAVAQTESYTLQGQVLYVNGNNLVVKMADGTTRQFDVQPGFMFDIDGKPTPVGELKPGTQLTAQVTTTEMPKTVVYENLKSGKLLDKVGQTLVVRLEDGTVKKFSNVSSDVVFTVDGKEMSVYDLKPGMNLTAHIITEETEIVKDRQVTASGTAPAAPVAPAKPAPAPAPAPAALPHTGSQLPLVGLTGLVLVALGLGLAIIRRF